MKNECPNAKQPPMCYNCGTRCGNIARNCTKVPLTATTLKLMKRKEKREHDNAKLAQEPIIGDSMALMARAKPKKKTCFKCKREYDGRTSLSEST